MEMNGMAPVFVAPYIGGSMAMAAGHAVMACPHGHSDPGRSAWLDGYLRQAEIHASGACRHPRATFSVLFDVKHPTRLNSHWRSVETRFLERAWLGGRLAPAQIAALMRRPAHAVECKAHRMGLGARAGRAVA